MKITKEKLKQIIKEELDNFNEGKLTDKEKAYKNIPDKHLNKAGDDKKEAIHHK